MSITVRSTEPDDAKYLTEWLMEPGVLKWFPMMDGKEVEDSVRLWINYAKLGAGLTALWDGEPCGMTILYVQPFQKLAHQCLFAIIVDQKRRGKGAGSILLQEQMKNAKEKFKIELLHLEVYDGNPARRLYKRLGFEKYGEQPRFIKEAPGRYRTKILMQKEL